MLRDSDNGKVLSEIGITRNGLIVQADKVDPDENVVQAPVLDANNDLTPRALFIFNEWFDTFKDHELTEPEAITPRSAVAFIKGVTHEVVAMDDNRIEGLFKAYNKAKDGKMLREEFLTFYRTAANDKLKNVYDNLRARLVREDLKKMSEVEEEAVFKAD